MARVIKPDLNLPIEAARMHTDALSIPAARDLTADEALEQHLRSLARRNWELGMTMTQISQVLDIAEHRLKEWRKLDAWPAAEEVKAQVKETRRDQVRRLREEMQLTHLQKQEEILNKQYKRLDEADANVMLSKDPAAAQVNVIKAAATVTKQFVELTGMKEAPAAAKGKGSSLNLNFLTGGGPKPVQVEAGSAPYQD